MVSPGCAARRCNRAVAGPIDASTCIGAVVALDRATNVDGENMFARRAILIGGGALLAGGLSGVALAHHGWRWAEDGNFELTGVIKAVRLGNPHGLVTVDARSVRHR